MMPDTIHATCVVRDGVAILITGRPGRGKSRLALRLMHAGCALLADDRVLLAGGPVEARTPPQPPGTRPGHALLEVRGLGLVEYRHASPAPVRLVIDLDRAPERLPEPCRDKRTGAPVLVLDPDDPAAVERALTALDCAIGILRLHATPS